MVNKGCLVMQSLSGDNLSLGITLFLAIPRDTIINGNFLYKYKFILQKGKFILYS